MLYYTETYIEQLLQSYGVTQSVLIFFKFSLYFLFFFCFFFLLRSFLHFILFFVIPCIYFFFVHIFCLFFSSLEDVQDYKMMITNRDEKMLTTKNVCAPRKKVCFYEVYYFSFFVSFCCFFLLIIGLLVHTSFFLHNAKTTMTMTMTTAHLYAKLFIFSIFFSPVVSLSLPLFLSF